jgi:hypothetical protein
VALNWLHGRIGPFIGAGERIWHPTLRFNGLHFFDLKLLATRWMLSYLCFFGVYNDRNLSMMPDLLRIMNHKQALLAGVPASITSKFFIAFSMSASILSIFASNNFGTTLQGGLATLMGGITNNKHGRRLATSGFSFNFICTVHSAPFRVTSPPLGSDGTPRYGSRTLVVRPDGSVESWDFVIHDLAAQLVLEHNKRMDGRDINAVIWTPDVMVAVSLEGTLTNSNPKITAYIHTDNRASRIVPTYHDPKQVVTREGQVGSIHSALLNDTNGSGYMKALVDNQDALIRAMST